VKRVVQGVLIVLVVAVLLGLAGTFYTLEEGQQAVIVQFGRPVGEPVTEAGLHVKLPFVQEVRRFEKRLLIWDGDPNQIPTKGRQFIWVDTTARKRIAAQFRSEGEGRSAEILGTMEKELRQIRSTAYRQVQESRGQADAEATHIYGEGYSRDAEFYAFSRTLELYGEGANQNAVLILTTDSDYYRYLKHATPAETEPLPAVGARDAKRP